MITYSIAIHVLMSLALIMFASYILNQEYNMSITKICFVLLVMTIVLSTGIGHVLFN